MTDRPDMSGRFFLCPFPAAVAAAPFFSCHSLARQSGGGSAIRASIPSRHSGLDPESWAVSCEVLHCAGVHPRHRTAGCRLGGRHDGAVAPFVLSPPLETLHAASLQCAVCAVIAAAPQGTKNGEHCRVLPVVVVAGRPRLAECGSELVFKRFAQLVHDGVDLLVGKRLLRVLEYEADGV